MFLNDCDDVRDLLGELIAAGDRVPDSVYWEVLHAQQRLTPLDQPMATRASAEPGNVADTLGAALAKVMAALEKARSTDELLALGHAARHLRTALVELGVEPPAVDGGAQAEERP